MQDTNQKAFDLVRLLQEDDKIFNKILKYDIFIS
jgi:hypothetical protein